MGVKMLQLKEQKNLVKPSNVSYDAENAVFSVKKITSTDGTESFEVDFDPVNKIISLEFAISNEDSILITLNAIQAVEIGRWLTEAGDIVNFIDKAGIQFTELEEENE
jgi:hypothetical protein